MSDDVVVNVVNRGAIKITKALLREGVFDLRSMLPPDHRVLHEKEEPGSEYVEWVIEGPHLPEIADDVEPPEVRLIVLIDRDVNTLRVKWQHRSDYEWRVPIAPMFND